MACKCKPPFTSVDVSSIENSGGAIYFFVGDTPISVASDRNGMEPRESKRMFREIAKTAKNALHELVMDAETLTQYIAEHYDDKLEEKDLISFIEDGPTTILLNAARVQAGMIPEEA